VTDPLAAVFLFLFVFLSIFPLTLLSSSCSASPCLSLLLTLLALDPRCLRALCPPLPLSPHLFLFLSLSLSFFRSTASQVLLVHEAKLLHAQGRVHRAVQLVEPSHLALAHLKRAVAAGGGAGGAGGAGGGDGSVARLGKRLLYATDWKVEAGLTAHGDHVLEQ